MSINDLYNFCLKNKFNHFSCNESNYELCVQVPAKGLFKKEDTDKHKEGLRPFTAKAYHDNVNLNKSEIDPDVFIENTKSAPFRPILANIVKDKDSDELDFGSHDFTIDEDENGNEIIVYQERPVGVINGDFSFEYDEEQEVNRAILNGYLYEEYCQDAIDILDRRGKVDCSIELNIREMSFNSSNKTLVLDDYYIGGLTLLGANVKPGMAGSNATLKDFSAENNENVHYSEVYTKLVEALDKLNLNLSMLDINKNSKEGGKGVNKLEELLEKYSKTKEDLTFDVEGLTDEELEAKFAESFDEADGGSDDTTDGTPSDEGTDTEGDEGTTTVVENEGQGEDGQGTGKENPDDQKDQTDDDPDDTAIISDDDEDTKKKKYTIEVNGVSRTFEVSLNDKIYALQDLVNATYGESDNTYYGITAYDDYVIMMDYWYGKAYKQSYKQDGDNFSLTGDRVEVFANWLTAEEEDALAEMRSNYSSIQEKLASYEKVEMNIEKDKVFESEDYKEYLEKEEFKSLIENKEKYSIEELKDKAEIAFARCVREFGLHDNAKNNLNVTSRKQFSGTNDKSNEPNPYGDLFND